MRKGILASILITIFILPSILQTYVAFGTHVFNELITFNTSAHTDGTLGNFPGSTFQAKVRSFFGDASPSHWVNSSQYDSLKTTAFTSTNPYGEFGMFIDGVRPNAGSFSLHKNIDDMDFPFVNGFTESSPIPIDQWIDAAERNCNVSDASIGALSVLVKHAANVRIQNPTVITSFNGTFTIAIDSRLQALDGQTLIDEQRINWMNFTYSNSNKATPLGTTGFTTKTITFVTATNTFKEINFSIIEKITIAKSGLGISHTANPKLDIDTFYDDVELVNKNWDISDTLTSFEPHGTCTNPSDQGEQEIVQNFKVRSWWPFDVDKGVPNSTINPDGYQGWVYTASNATAGVSVTGKWNITRTTERFMVVPTTAPILRSIDHDFSTAGGIDAGCMLTTSYADGSAVRSLFLSPRIMKIRLSNPNVNETFTFGLFYAAVTGTTSTSGDQCNIRLDVKVEVKDLNGVSLKSSTTSETLPTFGGTGSGFPQSASTGTGWNGTNFKRLVTVLDSAVVNQGLVDVFISYGWFIVSETGGGGAQFGNRFYDVFADQYETNWLTVDKTPTPEQPTSNPIIGKPTGGNTFCNAGNTDPRCSGFPPGLNIPGVNDPITPISLIAVPGIGSLQSACGQVINWTALSVTDTDTTVTTFAQFLNNILTFIGCFPNLVIPFATLFAGAGIVVGIGRNSPHAGYVFMVFMLVWLSVFTLFGFFPFWLMLIVGAGIAGMIVFMITKGVGGRSD